jgi:NAD(P)H-dependent FMN reductase
VAPERRQALVAALKAAYDALSAEAADGGPAEPPSLIYALH